MRLFANICIRKNCTNLTRAGFRFCYQENCGKESTEEE